MENNSQKSDPDKDKNASGNNTRRKSVTLENAPILAINNQNNSNNGNTNIYDSSKGELHVAKNQVVGVIHTIEETIYKKEEQRDYKMKIDFEREKDFILSQQAEIRGKIDNIATKNMNERMINYFKDEKNHQVALYNKYFTLNNEVKTKIKKINENLPSYEKKIKSKTAKLKELNQENLKLMEKINELENKKNQQKIENSILKVSNTENNEKMSKTLDDMNFTANANKTYNSKMKDSSILNITEFIEDNDKLKEKFERINYLKEKLRYRKKENKFIGNEISRINSQIYLMANIFTEGMHEISRELLKIHEIQLEKVLKGTNGSNTLYFELVKDRQMVNINGGYNMDEQLKLPIISNNIIKKYNYPLTEKSDPSTFIYNVVKNILDEHHKLNKTLHIKKKKFDWESFKNFSPYQIYTILSLNKDVIQKLENKIYLRNLSFGEKNESKKLNQDSSKKYGDEDIFENINENSEMDI